MCIAQRVLFTLPSALNWVLSSHALWRLYLRRHHVGPIADGYSGTPTGAPEVRTPSREWLWSWTDHFHMESGWSHHVLNCWWLWRVIFIANCGFCLFSVYIENIRMYFIRSKMSCKNLNSLITNFPFWFPQKPLTTGLKSTSSSWSSPATTISEPAYTVRNLFLLTEPSFICRWNMY